MKSRSLGQISIGPLEITGPVKARISGDLIPDFTIDLTTTPKVGMLSLIKPKITFLIGNKAYEVGWGEKGIKSADPSIFMTDTFMDTIQKIGIIPILLLASGAVFIGYHFLTKKEPKYTGMYK